MWEQGSTDRVCEEEERCDVGAILHRSSLGGGREIRRRSKALPTEFVSVDVVRLVSVRVELGRSVVYMCLLALASFVKPRSYCRRGVFVLVFLSETVHLLRFLSLIFLINWVKSLLLFNL